MFNLRSDDPKNGVHREYGPDGTLVRETITGGHCRRVADEFQLAGPVSWAEWRASGRRFLADSLRLLAFKIKR